MTPAERQKRYREAEKRLNAPLHTCPVWKRHESFFPFRDKTTAELLREQEIYHNVNILSAREFERKRKLWSHLFPTDFNNSKFGKASS